MKAIVVQSCIACPLAPKCKEWRGLTPKQKVTATISTAVQGVLETCPLPDYEEVTPDKNKNP